MAATQAGMKRFYSLFAVVAVAGLAVLGYLLTRPATVSIPANVTVQASDTSGFKGYVKGSSTAPVEITEYADYQCPFCQTFATLQMPTIEERLINTGRLRWRYRDFPFNNTRFPAWRLMPPPAPTSRASIGTSTGASTRASRSGPRRGTRPRYFESTLERRAWISPAMTPVCRPESTPAGSRPIRTRDSSSGWAPRQLS